MNESSIEKQSWKGLLSIQTGGALCLPIIMVGSLVCQKFGWLAALLSVGLGNLFLLIIGYLLTCLSNYRPQSTAKHAASYFGHRGGSLFASLMMVSMLGWFAIQLNIMSLCCQQLFSMLDIQIPYLFLNIGIGILISYVMRFGMKAMKGLSYITAPLLGLSLLYVIFSSKETLPPPAPLTLSWVKGLSLIIGANIVAIIDLPTFFRHAKSGRDAKICVVLLYAIVVPLIEIAGIRLSALTGENSILDILQTGHGSLWAIWISGFVLLSGWATNNANLYSSITSSYLLMPRCPPMIRTWIIGLIGTAIACFNPLGNLETILDFLGVAVGGMGAVILANFLLEKRSLTYKTFPGICLLSWSIGVMIAIFSSLLPWQTTGIPAFDAFITAFITQITFNLINQKRKTYETINS